MAKHHGIPAQLSLLAAIWLVTLLKVGVYGTVGRLRRDQGEAFWRAVAQELRALRV
jgi:hypothetical protein